MGVSTVSAKEVDADSSQVAVLSAFVENLESAINEGDVTAELARENFDNLSDTQKGEFADVLINGEIADAISGENTNPDVEAHNEVTPKITPLWMNGWARGVEACTTGSYLGVVVSKICTGGDFLTSAGIVQEVTNPYSYLAFDYDPIISFSKTSEAGWAELPTTAAYRGIWDAERRIDSISYTRNVRHEVRVLTPTNTIYVNDQIVS